MAKLKKRTYKALATVGSGGKWYTGWDGFAFTKEGEADYVKRYPHADLEHTFRSGGEYKRVDVLEEHEVRQLRLQFFTTAKGRSAAVSVFVDTAGHKYQMSFNTLDLILCLLHQKRGDLHQKYDISETRDREGTWVEGTFMQVKRGQNYFIEPVEGCFE